MKSGYIKILLFLSFIALAYSANAQNIFGFNPQQNQSIANNTAPSPQTPTANNVQVLSPDQFSNYVASNSDKVQSGIAQSANQQISQLPPAPAVPSTPSSQGPTTSVTPAQPTPPPSNTGQPTPPPMPPQKATPPLAPTPTPPASPPTSVPPPAVSPTAPTAPAVTPTAPSPTPPPVSPVTPLQPSAPVPTQPTTPPTSQPQEQPYTGFSIPTTTNAPQTGSSTPKAPSGWKIQY